MVLSLFTRNGNKYILILRISTTLTSDFVTIYLEGLADMAASNMLTSMVENNP